MRLILLTAAVATLGIGGYAFAQTHSPSATQQAGAAAREADDDRETDEASLAAQAKIPLVQAQAIALAARAGELKDHELKQEPGGSGLRYSFDILAAGKTWEVGVDASTGAVLENIEEGSNPD